MNDQAELRAEIKEMTAVLREIRDVLAAFLPEPKQPTGPPVCPHPMESRIDFGTTEGVPDWQCRECGFRTSEA